MENFSFLKKQTNNAPNLAVIHSERKLNKNPITNANWYRICQKAAMHPCIICSLFKSSHMCSVYMHIYIFVCEISNFIGNSSFGIFVARYPCATVCSICASNANKYNCCHWTLVNLNEELEKKKWNDWKQNAKAWLGLAWPGLVIHSLFIHNSVYIMFTLFFAHYYRLLWPLLRNLWIIRKHFPQKSFSITKWNIRDSATVAAIVPSDEIMMRTV